MNTTKNTAAQCAPLHGDRETKPAIRYAEFTGAWEQRKVGEIAVDTYGGGTPNTSVREYWDGDIPWIQSSDLTDGILSGATVNKRISKAGLMKSAAKLVPANSIAIITRVGVGKLAFMRFQYAASQDFLSLSRLKAEPWFCTYALYKKLQGELNAVQGTSIKGITKEVLLSKKIMLPTIDEQARIGSVFRNLDHLLTFRQREFVKLQNIKKALLEKMFPKDGADKPEIRFAGFTDAWEQRRLGELGSVAMCKRIFKEQTTESGDVPFFKIGTFGDEPDAFITRELFEEYKAKYPYPEIGDILISASGSIGRTVEYAGKDEYFQDSNIVWLKHDEHLDNGFLKHFYSVVKWVGIEGSTIKRLYNENILGTAISLPSLTEQQQIGAFFSTIDTLLTLHQHQLKKLKNIKKALLGKMFV
ncbi:MAG: restriction endonuclease subunit S [Azoarcus sp.]|jgi:type I restriction enzyme S subunit|nr:restriction endonuclease subunit S [Azoarcus sp.]